MTTVLAVESIANSQDTAQNVDPIPLFGPALGLDFPRQRLGSSY